MESGIAQQESKVSVCMAVHNGERFLRTQVESICQQLRPGDELVAVDDASRDDSVAVLDHLPVVNRMQRGLVLLWSGEIH